MAHYASISGPTLFVTHVTKKKLKDAQEIHSKIQKEKQADDHLPDDIKEGKDRMHKACYDKYTRILRGQTKPSAMTSTPRSTRALPPFNPPEVSSKAPIPNILHLSRRLSFPATNPFMYQVGICAMCNKVRLKVGNDYQTPIPLTNKSTMRDIKDYCNLKQDKYADLYLKIQRQDDLIGSNFHYHKKCHRDLTRKLPEKSISLLEDSTSRFKKVMSYIDEHVLNGHKPWLLSEALEMYKPSNGDNSPDAQRKRKERLKTKLQEQYGDDLIFLKSNGILMSSADISSKLSSAARSQDKVLDVASYMREEIERYAKKLPKLSWPPTMDELKAPERIPPEIVTSFYENLLKTQTKPR